MFICQYNARIMENSELRIPHPLHHNSSLSRRFVYENHLKITVFIFLKNKTVKMFEIRQIMCYNMIYIA